MDKANTQGFKWALNPGTYWCSFDIMTDYFTNILVPWFTKIKHRLALCYALTQKGRRKYRSSLELVSGPWSTRVAILMNMSMKAFYVETGSSGGLAWPQLMCCALDLLSADACKSCWW
jgi:hypothetical protein